MKIGRNQPCPCGSRKKYKKCCLMKSEGKFWGQIENDINVQEIWAQHKKFIQEEKIRKERLGEVQPIISLDHKGHKVVKVGSTLYFSKECKTFTDFLFYYIKKALGEDWGNNEIKKPDEEKHPIIRWYQDVCRIQALQQKGADGLYSMVPSGVVAGYINLAYDLYILADNLKLQKEVVNRLKKKDQFQGARYELYTAATCIRAGFNIDYEDESDRSEKHPEFIARHKQSGQVIAVEAKSRHRSELLGKSSNSIGEIMKADIGRLLSKAISKKPSMPYVIFIDLNLPPLPYNSIPEDLQTELLQTVDRISKNYGSPPDPFNLIIFTNHPHHYGDDNLPDPTKHVIISWSENPQHKPLYPESVKGLFKAALQYGNVPLKFSES